MGHFPQAAVLVASSVLLSSVLVACQRLDDNREYVLVPKHLLESTLHNSRSPYEAIRRPDRSAGSLYAVHQEGPSAYKEYYSPPPPQTKTERSPSGPTPIRPEFYNQLERDFNKHATAYQPSFPPSEYWEGASKEPALNNERSANPDYPSRPPYHQIYPVEEDYQEGPSPQSRPIFEYEPYEEIETEIAYPAPEQVRETYPHVAPDRYPQVTSEEPGSYPAHVNHKPVEAQQPAQQGDKFPNFKDRRRHILGSAKRQPQPVSHNRVSLIPTPLPANIGTTLTESDTFVREQKRRPQVQRRVPQRPTPVRSQPRPEPAEHPRYAQTEEFYPTALEVPNVPNFFEEEPVGIDVSQLPERRKFNTRRPPPRNSFRQSPGRNELPAEGIFITPPPPKQQELKKHLKKRPIKKAPSQAEITRDRELEAHKKKHKNNQLDNLQKLIDYADGGSRSKDPDGFQCPADGHFGDQDDCSKFYQCAHDIPLVKYCPGGLFWNSESNQCDWPEDVDCTYTAKSLEQYQLGEEDPVTIYLTFDDGPNEGTPAILEALRRQDVKATFFINSRNLHDPKAHVAAQNANNLLAIVADGHVLADHSYDHMAHNSKNSPKNAYKDVEEDLKYFGIMNTYPVLDILWKADMKEFIGPVNHTMSYYVRLPYTNAWRAGNVKRDCYACTVPGSSGQKGMAISDRLSAQKKLLFGWDTEWEIDWNKNRFKFGGKEMFFRLARDPRKKPQMVILSHDVAHRPYEIRDEQRELEDFIRLAKESGYKFATIDKYELH
eukprot:maker-scaffold22_size673200-snap-gene-4.22 protein:Tk12687 transcript:maker-scaffold22_size673200-snap-gene-4.22-mRNA-1 annotation:"polysaccharide deacetylase"